MMVRKEQMTKMCRASYQEGRGETAKQGLMLLPQAGFLLPQGSLSSAPKATDWIRLTWIVEDKLLYLQPT